MPDGVAGVIRPIHAVLAIADGSHVSVSAMATDHLVRMEGSATGSHSLKLGAALRKTINAGPITLHSQACLSRIDVST